MVINFKQFFVESDDSNYANIFKRDIPSTIKFLEKITGESFSSSYICEASVVKSIDIIISSDKKDLITKRLAEYIFTKKIPASKNLFISEDIITFKTPIQTSDPDLKGFYVKTNFIIIDNKPKIIAEGGAAGHMAHVFDLPQANTGNDIIKIFQQAVKSISANPGSLKVDGVNISLKVVNKNNKLQFAMDRGSTMHQIDREGITVDDLEKRFPPAHGMTKIGKLILPAFTDAIPFIISELKILGLIQTDTNNCNILNTEYVHGRTNVVDYGRNLLAFHGIINARFEGKKRIKTNITYNKKAMQSLAKKLDDILIKSIGFNVYASNIDLLTVMHDNIDFNAVLSTPFTIEGETKKLSQWADEAENPRDAKIITTDDEGKKVEIKPMSDKTYLIAIGKNAEYPNLKAITKDPKQLKELKNGVILKHLAVVLGDEVLKNLSVKKLNLKTLQGQEGIVVNDPKIFSGPFKITGSFILNKMKSTFQKATTFKDEYIKDKDSIWYMYPGSFKPPTIAHYENVKKNIGNIKGSGKFIIFIGSDERGGITPAQSKKIWTDLYKPSIGDIIVYTPDDLKKDPALTKYAKSDKSYNSPVTVLNWYIREYAIPGQSVILLLGAKDIGDMRFSWTESFTKETGIDVRVKLMDNVMVDGHPASASEFRQALRDNNKKIIKKYIPAGIDPKIYRSYLPDKITESISFSDFYLSESDKNINNILHNTGFCQSCYAFLRQIVWPQTGY